MKIKKFNGELKNRKLDNSFTNKSKKGFPNTYKDTLRHILILENIKTCQVSQT
ncbi:hypothetical protein QWY93_00060 [Echinicola jeungdonensis]|uniref:hypothetical protein n=1 Tax=Echinicola jeungdonensis TaxID=709343 RepID=UPI0025B3EC80|nr:hypothetical protein [Echinicola jeungdonensis]MDN3667737.1 hypothetical protein [Echinicola jeungdonensis]